MTSASHHHFVLGYGSLICRHSRALTAHSPSAATPVLVHGIERVWSKRSRRLGMTAMGIRYRAGASCVGVILPVEYADLALFDRREQGYARRLIPLEDVTLVPFLGDSYYKKDDHKVFLDAKRHNNINNAPDNIKIWAYFPNTIAPPDANHPIVQTYVDTILRGCLDVGGEEFAKEFIQQTKAWNPTELVDHTKLSSDGAVASSSGGITDDSCYFTAVWVDDRHDPVYIRGDVAHSRQNADKFDELLRTYNPKRFEERKVMPTRA